MLHVPRQSYQAFAFDNFGANPSTTTGTSVIPGASSAEGSWTQVATGANIAQDVYGFYLQVHSGTTSATAKLHVLDVGVDPAGGSSYTPIITDLVCGGAPTLTAAGLREHFFPFFIKAGSSVAVRISGNQATAGTVRVVVRFFGQISAQESFPAGTYSESYGVSGTSGTAITPGNAADGSWTSIGTTTNPIWWWQLGYQLNNSGASAEYTYFELALGDVTNKQTVFKVMHGGSAAEICGLLTQSQLLWHSSYVPVPGGTGVYVSARCNNAPDTGYQVGVIGIGG